MPINESKIVRRERWPLAFDLEGVPREDRGRFLDELRHRQANPNFDIPELDYGGEDPLDMQTQPVKNTFAADQPPAATIVDINNPPTKRYVHQEFPKLVYHHESGHVLEVKDDRQYVAAAKRGFHDRPAADRDYSKVRSGMVAPLKQDGPEREKPITAEELDRMEATAQAELDGDGTADADFEVEVQPRNDEAVETRPAARRKGKK